MIQSIQSNKQLTPEFVSSLLFREAFGNSITNELIFAGRKLTSSEVKELKFVSGVGENQQQLNEMALNCAKQMTSWPLADKTLPLFKKMVRYPARIQLLENIHEMEMEFLNQRLTNGESAEAIMILLQQQKKSKL